MKGLLCLFLVSFFAFSAVVTAEDEIKTFSGGAVYSMTNGAPNYVLVSRVNSSGYLSYVGRYATGGNGVGEVSGSCLTAADPLLSQGSVRVSECSRYLFVVNAGSNTLSFFRIGIDDPTELKLVGVYDTGYDFPTSVSYSPQLRIACVIGTGAKNGLRCFQVWKSGLLLLPDWDRPTGLTQTTPPVGPPNTLSDVIFSQKSDAVYVSVKGLPGNAAHPGALNIYAISSSRCGSPVKWSLAATPVVVAATSGLLPFSLTLVYPDLVLATDPAVGLDLFTVRRTRPTGDLVTSVVTVPLAGQQATCWSVYSKPTGYVYVSDPNNGTISEIDVTPARWDGQPTASIVAVSPIGNAAFDIVNTNQRFTPSATAPFADLLFAVLLCVRSIGVLALGSGAPTLFDVLTLPSESGFSIGSQGIAFMPA